MTKLLFVCTGNTCRSAMAEGIMKDILKKRKRDDIQVYSAGLCAISNGRASDEAIEALRIDGIDIENHRSTPITKDILDNADLIITMTKSHKDVILMRFPYMKGKVYTLKECAYGVNEDILDPFGGDLEVYIRTKGEIKKALNLLMEKI
jgi:protein-tyrosine-phosphatase